MQILRAALVVCVLTLLSINTAISEDAVPKNIIMIIGDGMGLNHIAGAKIVKGTLNLEQFPVTGFYTSYALDDIATTSQAGTTAMVTGENTLKEYLSLNKNGKPLKTVLEYAQELNKGTGIVVTSTVTDSTSACLFAHVPSRLQQLKVAEALVKSNIDVVVGGGWRYFVPSSVKGSARKDNKDLISILGKDHKIIRSADELRNAGKPKRFAAFLNENNLPPVIRRTMSLAEMTQKALDSLSQYENGFFLMVEASQLDWSAHLGFGEGVIREVIDLDNTAGIALEFAKADMNTLVIVVSDHETGGFTVLDGSLEEKKITKAVFFSDDHTAALLPIFAYGPGSNVFSGMYDNTFIGKKLIEFVTNKDSALQ